MTNMKVFLLVAAITTMAGAASLSGPNQEVNPPDPAVILDQIQVLVNSVAPGLKGVADQIPGNLPPVTSALQLQVNIIITVEVQPTLNQLQEALQNAELAAEQVRAQLEEVRQQLEELLSEDAVREVVNRLVPQSIPALEQLLEAIVADLQALSAELQSAVPEAPAVPAPGIPVSGA